MSVPLSRFDSCRRIIGLLGVLAALLVLPGCSAVKLAYNNVPDLAYWWIDGYVDLNETQTPRLRDELGRLHQWHRSAELPRIADLLQKIQRMAPAETTPEQVCGLFNDARARVDALMARAEPAAVVLAMGLGAAQWTHLEDKYAKANLEWRDEWSKGTDTERQARRLKASIERSEQFYGTLDERQTAVLRNALTRSEFDPQLSYTERLRRQQDLLQTLRSVSATGPGPRPGLAQATSALRAYLDRSVNSPNPVYRAYSERSIQDSCKTIAQLHNAATPEQRDRAVRRLAAYERDARELAAQR